MKRIISMFDKKLYWYLFNKILWKTLIIMFLITTYILLILKIFLKIIYRIFCSFLNFLWIKLLLFRDYLESQIFKWYNSKHLEDYIIFPVHITRNAANVPLKKPERFNFKNQCDSYTNYSKISMRNIKNFKSNREFKGLIRQLILLLYHIISRPILIVTDILGLLYFFHVLYRVITILYNELLSYNYEKYNKPYYLKFIYNPKMRRVILRVRAIKYFGKRTWGQTIAYYLVIFLQKVLELRLRYTEYGIWYFSPVIAERFETLSFMLINRDYLKFHFIRFINFIIFKKWRILYSYIIIDFLFFAIKLVFQLIKNFLLIFFSSTNVKLSSYFEKINFYLEYYNNKISSFLNRILQMLSTIYSIVIYWVIVDLFWFKILRTLCQFIYWLWGYISHIRRYILEIIKLSIEKPEKLQYKELKKFIIFYTEQYKAKIYRSMDYFWVLILCIEFRNFILQKLILDKLFKLFTMLWEIDSVVNVDLQHDEIDYEWLIWEDYDNTDIDWETEHYCIDIKEFEHPEIQQPVQIMPSIIYTKFWGSQRSSAINGSFEKIERIKRIDTIYFVFKWLKKIKFVLNFTNQAAIFKWVRKFQFIWKFKWERKFQFTWKFKEQEIMHRLPVLRDYMPEIKKELYKKKIFFTNNNKIRDVLVPRMRHVWQYYNKNKNKYEIELKKFIGYIMQKKNKEYNLRKFYYILDKKRVKMRTPCRYSLMRSYSKDQIMFKKFNFVIVRLLNEYFSSLKKRNLTWWWYLVYELDYTKYILQRKRNYSQIIQNHIRYDSIDYYKKNPLPENIYNTRFLALRQTFTRLCQIEKFYWKNANVKIIEFAWHFLFLEIKIANELFYCKNKGNLIYKIRRYGRYQTNLYNIIKKRSNISGAVWYTSRQRYVEWSESRNVIWYKSKKLDVDSSLTIARWSFYNHLYCIKPAKFFYKYMTENIVLTGYPLFYWFARIERFWWWFYSPPRIMATIGKYNWALFRHGLKLDYHSWYMYNIQNIRTNVKPVIDSWFEEKLESLGGPSILFPKKRDYQTWYRNISQGKRRKVKWVTEDLAQEIPISLEQQNNENIMAAKKVWRDVPGFNTKWDENIDVPDLSSTIQYNSFLYKQKYSKRSRKNIGVLHITDELTFQKKFKRYIRRTGSEKFFFLNKCYKYQTTLLELYKLLKIGKYRFNIHMDKFLFIHSIVVCNIIKNIDPITIILKFFNECNFRLPGHIEIYRKILFKIINTIENNRERSFLIDILYSSSIKDVKIIFEEVIDYLKFWKSLIFNIECWSTSKIANINWDFNTYALVMSEKIYWRPDDLILFIAANIRYFKLLRWLIEVNVVQDLLKFWKCPIFNDREWLLYNNKEIKKIGEFDKFLANSPFINEDEYDYGVEKYWNLIKFWWKFYCECYLKMLANKNDEITNSWLIFILALNEIKKWDDFCNHIQWWCNIFKELSKIYNIDINYFDEKKLRWAFFWLINELDQHLILLDYWIESDDWIFRIFEECDTIVWYSENKLNK